jgi:hypothetical protein
MTTRPTAQSVGFENSLSMPKATQTLPMLAPRVEEESLRYRQTPWDDRLRLLKPTERRPDGSAKLRKASRCTIAIVERLTHAPNISGDTSKITSLELSLVTSKDVGARSTETTSSQDTR